MKKRESCRAESHFAYFQLLMIYPSELIIADDQFGCGWFFFLSLFKCWIINRECPDFSHCNEWRVLSMQGMNIIMPSQSSLSIAQMCYLQHVQLHSQIRDELNQEIPSHYAWGQWLPLLTEEGQILLFSKICNLATEQLIERMRTWLTPNSWHCRWSQQGFFFFQFAGFDQHTEAATENALADDRDIENCISLLLKVF